MEDQQKVKDEIRVLEIELSKHRKLLHRATGNRILAHINYHHYEIVRLIGEIEKAKSRLFFFPLIGVADSHGDILDPGFFQKLKDAWNEAAKMPMPIIPMSNLTSIRMAYDEKILTEITPEQAEALNALGEAGKKAGERMRELYMKYEDEAILNGEQPAKKRPFGEVMGYQQFQTTVSPDGSYMDHHLPADKPKDKKK